ncbi:hypothetical protein B6U82_00475 [Candidatus Pacearchaeota archaeon ex4484_31]|nr:MAG: hypothetical protein B6U82_00475 [Candidatus Pacearchaeota archaeon ex4484_31]
MQEKVNAALRILKAVRRKNIKAEKQEKEEEGKEEKERPGLTEESKEITEEMRKKLESLSIEKEAAPLYKRKLPPLPLPPSPKSLEMISPPLPSLPSSPSSQSLQSLRGLKERSSSEKGKEFISLGFRRLDELLNDKEVKTIQCDGANIPVKVTRNNEVIETTIMLTEEEIKSIVKRFAELANTELTEPAFSARFNGLEISAYISVFRGTKFIIRRTE